ncbi:hypothetical protein MMC10_004648 [Thelotrema lepadinum]|nr:hypothetical protein [Thelotrema lepadinum]
MTSVPILRAHNKRYIRNLEVNLIALPSPQQQDTEALPLNEYLHSLPLLQEDYSYPARLNGYLTKSNLAPRLDKPMIFQSTPHPEITLLSLALLKASAATNPAYSRAIQAIEPSIAPELLSKVRPVGQALAASKPCCAACAALIHLVSDRKRDIKHAAWLKNKIASKSKSESESKSKSESEIGPWDNDCRWIHNGGNVIFPHDGLLRVGEWEATSLPEWMPWEWFEGVLGEAKKKLEAWVRCILEEGREEEGKGKEKREEGNEEREEVKRMRRGEGERGGEERRERGEERRWESGRRGSRGQRGAGVLFKRTASGKHVVVATCDDDRGKWVYER